MIVYHSLEEAEIPEGPNCAALGLFDGLHPGHRAVIGQAVDRARRENAAACVFTFVMDRHHPAAKPAAGRLMTTTTRDRLLREMGVTHLVCPSFEEFRQMPPEEYVRVILRDILKARHVYCGKNYHFGRKASGDVETLRRLGQPLGMEVHIVPTVEIGGDTVASTRVRKHIAAGEMVEATALLGRPFRIDFEVIHGRSLGRTLDFPTINQAFPDNFIKPKFGVYASIAHVEGRAWISVTNVGVKPTVGSDRILAETCILGYQGDLYGQRIPVEFLRFIRPEKKFTSLPELREQIRRDVQVAKGIASLANFRYNEA